ncbi:MAG: hypothetical protein K0Q72_2403 [Armatimonadetes bacterium]|nr:hypothetical protein [Armatimonadota bacterium]
MLYNSLRNPDELEVDASGISPFLIEQQGVYRCGTRVEDDDGPVFRQDYGASDWRPCASRLSDFLLWALVYELMVCRELTVWGYFTPDHAAKVTAEMTRVAMGGVSTYGIESDIYHADEIAIFWSENKPTEICLEGIARSAAGFARLTTLGEWSDE